MKDASEKLNNVYEVKTGPGESLGLRLVVAYQDAPTFTLEDVNGEKSNWREDMCKEATQDQEVEYWRERATRAEERERFRGMSPLEQCAVLTKRL